MKNYYSKSLHSTRLQKCYEIAPKRVKQFLEAEIDFVLSRVNENTTVLDLGCGYGRVSSKLSSQAKKVVGIDISKENIDLAKGFCSSNDNCEFYVMNAVELEFEDDTFDLVICVQNGISAFKVSPEKLLREAIRVTKRDGIVLFSSYSEKFWHDRLKWFEIQAQEGLIGKIDYTRTKSGTIHCLDGFKATTYSAKKFLELASNFKVKAQIHEVDNSSVFCEMIVK